MKDENSGKVMTEFIGLRAKMYALDVQDGKVTKKAKGVKKCVVKNKMTIDEYRQCLFDKTEVYKTMNLIRSKNHDIYSLQLNKKALSPYDDKRHILEDGLHTLAWGHYRI